jgi:general secretion pathway protein K
MVSILVVLVLETLRAMQVEEAGSRYHRDSLQAEALARSGVNLAMAVLAKDLEENGVDHPGEPWAAVPLPDSLPVPPPQTGTLAGQVNDEAGKFPINYLVNERGTVRPAYRQVLERLLGSDPFGLDPVEVRALVVAITDWLDPDDEPTGELGAETDYYQSLGRTRGCRNGPLTALSELRLVRGMTGELYLGRGGDPGLKDLLTVFSDGRININTASPLILQAMVSPVVSPQTAATWAESVVAFRDNPLHRDFLGESDWYRNRMAGFNDIILPATLSTTRSAHFSVAMTGSVGVGRKSVFACLSRQLAKTSGGRGRVRITVEFWEVF